ncbi:MAG: hypothetical protein K5930_01155 [Treponemataceae bacterium]|nr:hypothetical protein [Treponemataceae bacterium]
MNNTVLIVGGSSPINTSLAEAGERTDNKVLCADSSRSKNSSFAWNPPSPISARSLILQAENTFETIGTVLLPFDADSYEDYYAKLSVETISKGVDNMFLGYFYIVSELLTRFEKYGEGNLVFFYNDDPGKDKGILTSSAAASFCALAKKTATLHAGKPMGIVLVKSETNSFQESSDWLFQYLMQPGAQKASLNAKYASHWLKPGSKPPVMIPFLSR